MFTLFCCCYKTNSSSSGALLSVHGSGCGTRWYQLDIDMKGLPHLVQLPRLRVNQRGTNSSLRHNSTPVLIRVAITINNFMYSNY